MEKKYLGKWKKQSYWNKKDWNWIKNQIKLNVEGEHWKNHQEYSNIKNKDKKWIKKNKCNKIKGDEVVRKK